MKLRGIERETLLKILAYLVEIDRRRLYLPLGYPSLFEFCRGRLGYSEASAGRRIAAARCMRDFPRVYDLLAAGRTTLGAIARIARVITSASAEKLLSEIEGRSEREVEAIVSRRCPQSAIRERVRPVWVRTELRVEHDRQDTGLADPAAGASHGAGGGENFTLGAESEKFPTSLQLVSCQEDTNQSSAKSLPPIWQTSGSDDPKQYGGDKRATDVESPTPGWGGDGAGNEGGRTPVSGAGGTNASGVSAEVQTPPSKADDRLTVLEQHFKIEFGVEEGFLEKVERVRMLLSSRHHGKLELGRLFEIMMDEYLERHSPEARLRRKAERKQKARGKNISNRRSKGGGEKKSGWHKKAGQENANGERCKPEAGTFADETGTAGKVAARSGSKAAASTGGSDTPPSPAGSSRKDPRHIPRRVREEVWARDKGRCAFVSAGGRRCGSRWDLEIDHILPVARGGGNEPGNLRLLCSRHNRLEAEREFGEKHMARFRGTRGTSCRS